MSERERRVAEVQKWAEKLSQAFLYCRAYGHNWRPWTAKWVDEYNCYEQTLRCGQCKNERTQLLDRSGMPVKTKYRHQPGYLHKGMGRITGEGRGMVRLEALKRQIKKPPRSERR